MATDVIERLRYYQRQYLSAADFADEQAYHRDMRRRHNIGLHTWGIVAGLELDERGPVQGAVGPIQISIRPGMAIDGYGREILLLETVELPPDPRLFGGLTASAYVPVWIAYDEEQTRHPEPGYEQCEDEADQFGRLRERFRLMVGPRGDLHDAVVVDGQLVEPPAIPADESVSYQEFSNDVPLPTWLVRLGSVNWNGPQQEFGQNDPDRLAEERRYAGSVAAVVYGPTGLVRIAPRFTPPAPAAGQRAAPVAEVVGPLHVEDYLRVDNDALVGGRVGVKTDEPRNPVGIRGTGTWEELLSFEAADGTTKWHVNQLFAGTTSGLNIAETGVADSRLFIKAGGNVGIGTGNPTNRLHVDDATGIRQGRLYLSGGSGNGWSSLTYNAHHDAANAAWVFPDNGRPAATLEMDAAPGSGGRFEVWGTTVGSTQTWVKRLRIDLESGDIQLAPGGGRVGVGSLAPRNRLAVRGTGTWQELLSFEATDGTTKWHLNQLLNGTDSGLNFAETGVADSRLFIKAGGNVGIGTGTPSERLHVNGNLRVSGNLIVDGGLPQVNVRTYTRSLKNNDGAPNNWTIDHAGDFQQVYRKFVVFQGFSIQPLEGNVDWWSEGGVTAVGHAFVRLDDNNDLDVNSTSGFCFVHETGVGADVTDNCTLFSLVIIGR
jgi:hypothetical protein